MLYTEIEHKFIVDASFDLPAFRAKLHALGPERTNEVEVEDTYFLLAAHPEYVFRHRFDRERQELTVKNRSERDPEVRLEVNLKLDSGDGSQRAAVEAFLRPLGLHWQGTIHKHIEVFYFPDCEVVYYLARTAERSVRCVEFEARKPSDVAAAQAVLARYEARTGFDAHSRATQSLFDLLLLPAAPSR